MAVTYLAVNQAASWWVGTPAMLPFVLVGGLLMTRKIRRFELVFSFMEGAAVLTLAAALLGRQSPIGALSTLLLYSPLFFFAFVMLTEPLTAPPTAGLRNLYGALVGVLFTPAFHLGSFYTTPEIALLIGNAFAWLVSPKNRVVLYLKQKRQIAPHAWDFIFAPSGRPARKLAFAPGQYMEWTLGHEEPDSRGVRRYFTLASSPTEPEVRLGVRVNQPSSSYKEALLAMDPGDEIIAGQLAGDFTLPRDPKQPLVFIAGGIGITPYRSMIKYLLDTHEHRPITLFYSAVTPNDFVYRDVFHQAERELSIRAVYVAERTQDVPAGPSVLAGPEGSRDWTGEVGRIRPELIQACAPDYQESMFYVSGPNVMVDAVKGMLRKMGIPDGQIRADFFAGL